MEYYEQVQNYYRQFTQDHEEALPGVVRHHKHAPAYYGIIHEHMGTYSIANVDIEAVCADAAVKMEEIIEELKIRDWIHSQDVQNKMKNRIEDYLFSLKGRYDLPLTWDDIDTVLEQVIHTAKQRDAL